MHMSKESLVNLVHSIHCNFMCEIEALAQSNKRLIKMEEMYRLHRDQDAQRTKEGMSSLEARLDRLDSDIQSLKTEIAESTTDNDNEIARTSAKIHALQAHSSDVRDDNVHISQQTALLKQTCDALTASRSRQRKMSVRVLLECALQQPPASQDSLSKGAREMLGKFSSTRKVCSQTAFFLPPAVIFEDIRSVAHKDRGLYELLYELYVFAFDTPCDDADFDLFKALDL